MLRSVPTAHLRIGEVSVAVASREVSLIDVAIGVVIFRRNVGVTVTVCVSPASGPLPKRAAGDTSGHSEPNGVEDGPSIGWVIAP